jgi:RsiW-degrading membrane proteinase PrsW (M82 family)
MISKSIAMLIAILPGIAICWYIYTRDKYEKESRLQLAITFSMGLLITMPVMKIESWAHHMGWDDTSNLLATLVSSFIIVSLTEELIKYLCLMAYPYQRPFFNEPMDGIVYAVMISMGFATLENILYATQYGIGTTLLRAFTAVPAHAAFAIIMGYYVGLSKFTFKRSTKMTYLALGLAIPIGIHGLYDFFILQEAIEELMALALVVLGLSIYFSKRLIDEQQENSPFKD